MKKSCKKGMWLIALVSILTISSAQRAEEVTYDAQKFQVFRTPAKMVNLHWMMESGQKYKTLEALDADLKNKGLTPLMLTNAGIYESGETPCGLHVEGGKVINALNTSDAPGNFYLKPNGVFSITNGKAEIQETSAYQQEEKLPDLVSHKV